MRHGITNSQTVCSTDTDHVTSHVTSPVTPESRHKTQLADLQKQVESLGAQMQVRKISNNIVLRHYFLSNLFYKIYPR